MSRRGRNRRGRHRKSAPRSVETGRLVQPTVAEKVEDVLAGPLLARARIFDMTLEEAKTVERWTVVWRMCRDGLLSPKQRRAAEAYVRVVEKANRAYMVKPLASGSDMERLNSSRVSPELPPDAEEDYTEWCRHAIQDYKDCRHALLTCGDPFAMLVLEAIACDGRELWGPEAVGSLRMACNAVDRVMFPESRRAA